MGDKSLKSLQIKYLNWKIHKIKKRLDVINNTGADLNLDNNEELEENKDTTQDNDLSSSTDDELVILGVYINLKIAALHISKAEK